MHFLHLNFNFYNKNHLRTPISHYFPIKIANFGLIFKKQLTLVIENAATAAAAFFLWLLSAAVSVFLVVFSGFLVVF
jgi:hypothetical protein